MATPDVGMPSRYVLLEVSVSEITIGTLLPLRGRVFLQHVLDDGQLVVVVLAAVRTEVAVRVFRVGFVPALPLHFTPTGGHYPQPPSSIKGVAVDVCVVQVWPLTQFFSVSFL